LWPLDEFDQEAAGRARVHENDLRAVNHRRLVAQELNAQRFQPLHLLLEICHLDGNMVHSFATLLALLGEIESVQALRAPQRFLEMQGDDTSIALVRFASGVVGTVVESFCMKSLATAAGAEVHTLRIDGALGHLRVTAPHTLCVYSEAPSWATEGEIAERVIHVPEEDTFCLEAAHFLSCLRNGAEPLTSGRAQRRPLEIVLAAYRSMETGQPVGLR